MADINDDHSVTQFRHMADRLGLRLTKSRNRDPNAMDHGLYALIDVETGGATHEALAGRWVHSMTLEEVAQYLNVEVAEAADATS